MCKYFLSISTFILLGFTNILQANTVVPFELINGLIVINAEINGTVGNYILDSGANGILLNGSVTSSEVSYQSISSSIMGSETRIESVRVGNFEIFEIAGFSTDLSNLENYIDKSLAGILGTAVFTPNILEFDFDNSTLVISEESLKEDIVQEMHKLHFDMVEDLPIIELSIQGRPLAFILDSGASSHFIDQNILKLLKNSKTGVSRDIITASKDIQVSKEYEINDCAFGEKSSTLKFFGKDFSNFSDELNKEIHGLISLSQLANGKMFMDVKKQRLYF